MSLGDHCTKMRRKWYVLYCASKCQELDQTNVLPYFLHFTLCDSTLTQPYSYTTPLPPHIPFPGHNYIFSWDTERKWVFHPTAQIWQNLKQRSNGLVPCFGIICLRGKASHALRQRCCQRGSFRKIRNFVVSALSHILHLSIVIAKVPDSLGIIRSPIIGFVL